MAGAISVGVEAQAIDTLFESLAPNEDNGFCTAFQIFNKAPFYCGRAPWHCQDTWPPYQVMRAMAFLQPVLGSGGLIGFSYYAQFGCASANGDSRNFAQC